MNDNVLADRYAHSLLEIALEQGVMEPVRDGLAAFSAAYEQSSELQKVLKNSEIPVAKRRAIVEAVCSAIGCERLVVDILALLVSKRRMDIVAKVASSYCDRVAAATSCTTCEVVVADAALAEHAIQRVKELIREKLGLMAICRTRIDPQLIGGIALTVGDMRYDASIGGRLKHLEDDLMHRGVHGY